MARLEKRREAKRKQLQKRKSQTAQNIEGIEKKFEEKLQKQINDTKHVMAHLEGGVGESSQDAAAADDEKWVELFDEASGQPYWWSKANGSTWERPESVDNHVFHTVHSNKCTAETNRKHVQKFLRSNSMSHTDIENFTLKWIDEHAARTERLKNQELWEKTLQLEEKLAHEREKMQGADLQMMEQLASPTGQEVVPGQESSAGAAGIVNAVFESGPLGLELVGRTSGGVIIEISTARIPSGPNPKHTPSDGRMHHQRRGLLKSGSVNGEEKFAGNVATDRNNVYTARRVELHNDNVAG